MPAKRGPLLWIYSLALALAFLLLTYTGSLLHAAPQNSCADIDAYGKVVYVVDGDTVDVVVLRVYDPRYSGFLHKKIRVRLADINASELTTSEGRLAKEYMKSLVYGKKLYLDIDDLYIYGRYGRVIAVLYLPINATHLLNINLYLVEKGYAEIRDYPNEFRPYLWRLYTVPCGENPSPETERMNTASLPSHRRSLASPGRCLCTVTMVRYTTLRYTYTRTRFTTVIRMSAVYITVQSLVTVTKTITVKHTYTPAQHQLIAPPLIVAAIVSATVLVAVLMAIRRR